MSEMPIAPRRVIPPPVITSRGDESVAPDGVVRDVGVVIVAGGSGSRTGSADILARFSTDLASVEYAIVLALPAAILSACGLLVSAIILALLEWRLALLAFIGVPLCLIGPRLLGPRAAREGYRLKDQQASEDLACGSTASKSMAAARCSAGVVTFSIRFFKSDRVLVRLCHRHAVSRPDHS